MGLIYQSNEEEYWRHVSPQDKLPLAGEVSTSGIAKLNELLADLNATMGSESKEKLTDYTEDSNNKDETDKMREWVERRLIEEPSTVDHLRKLVGIKDKRLYLDLSYDFRATPHPDKDTGLCGCPKDDFIAHQTSVLKNKLGSSDPEVRQRSSEVFADYFVERGVLDVLEIFRELDDPQVETVIENVIMPHDLQMEEAKRRGHGAEAVIASLLDNFGEVEVLPEDKAANPMSSDVRLAEDDYSISDKKASETDSYDLLIRDEDEDIHVLGVLGLVHSSDPGEYGVGKTGRTEEYQSRIEEYNENHDADMELWALVDGCGFGDNKGTLRAVLNHVDEFVQMNTAYKFLVHLHEKDIIDIHGIEFDRKFYDSDEIDELTDWSEARGVKTGVNTDSFDEVEAGKAKIYV